MSKQLVLDFIDAWNRIDFDTVLDMLAEDVFYHNIPMDPIEGKAGVKAFIDAMGPVEKVHWEVYHIAESNNSDNNSVVLTERLDTFVIGGKDIAVPVMGTFEFKDGKIQAWRDYFDLPTFQNQMV